MDLLTDRNHSLGNKPQEIIMGSLCHVKRRRKNNYDSPVHVTVESGPLTRVPYWIIRTGR